MFNADALRQVFSITGAAWTSTAILLLFVIRVWNGSPAMFAQWVAYRRAKADERSADWARLRDEIMRLDAATRESREAERRCNDELLDVKKRLAALEGYEIGRGKAANEVTVLRGSGNGDGSA